MHLNVRKQMNVVERNEDGVNCQCSRKKTQIEKSMVSNILHTCKLNEMCFQNNPNSQNNLQYRCYHVSNSKVLFSL